LEIITSVYDLLDNNNGVIRTADALKNGISRTTLGTLVKTGKLDRIAHGQYIRPDNIPDDLFILQQRSKKIIFSHETALFLHDLAERTPLYHSITISSNDKLSSKLSEGCKVYYVNNDLYGNGQCILKTKMGNDVYCYNVERTICDIVRSRNRIDSQTFAEALKAYAARNDHNWNSLRKFAEMFHITKLLRQYIEVLL